MHRRVKAEPVRTAPLSSDELAFEPRRDMGTRGANPAGSAAESRDPGDPREGEVMTMGRKCTAELLGTFWLVFGGCGSAVLAAAFPGLGIGFAGVALAFGLTVLTMAYAVGPISGAHLNPAVSFGAWIAKRIGARDLGFYVLAQVAGAILAAAVLYVIARGSPDFSLAGGFASNGFAAHSPGDYSLGACLLAELVLTSGFVFVVLAVTDKERSPDLAPLAPLAIGLALTLVHLVGIPATNTSVNPARSTGPALFVGGWALSQLWLFWLAPLVGGALAGVAYPLLSGKERPATTFRSLVHHHEPS